MSLPTERISLNRIENAGLRSGLNTILNQFAAIQYGNRRAANFIDPALKNNLQPRSLTVEGYELILGLRNRLAAVADQNRSKHRFTVIEYAVLGFALRVARRFSKVEPAPDLGRKIEKHRKRAKRRTIDRIGLSAYQQAAKRWACSSRWIRFHLLPSRAVRRGWLFKPREFYREQFELILGIAHTEIAERCTEPLSNTMLSRLVKLIIREVRRGRHPGCTVRELLNNDQRAKNFLFELIRKKHDGLMVKFEFRRKIEQRAEISKRMRAALNTDSAGAEFTGRVLRFTEDQIVCCLATFLKHAVGQSFWESLLLIAARIIRNSGPLAESQWKAGDLEQVLRGSQPMGTFKPGFEELEHLSAWLAHFLLQCGSTGEQALELLRRAMQSAAGLTVAAA